MELQPFSQSFPQVRAFITIGLLLALILTVSSNSATQNANNPSQLSLSSTDDGFKGIFTYEGRRYSIENRVDKESLRTLVAASDGRVLMRASRKGNLLSVTLPTGNISLDLANPGRRAEAETQNNALMAFVNSSDAALMRRIVYEVRNRRLIEKRPFLLGFKILAMYLGDGDVAIAASEKEIDRSKLQFKMVGVKCSLPAAGVVNTKRTCDESNCCGCCGPSCWGCSGCWLPECRAHDECVDTNGYLSPTCMALLDVAIAAMVTKCGGGPPAD